MPLIGLPLTEILQKGFDVAEFCRGIVTVCHPKPMPMVPRCELSGISAKQSSLGTNFSAYAMIQERREDGGFYT